jgi:hypothetical protein
MNKGKLNKQKITAIIIALFGLIFLFSSVNQVKASSCGQTYLKKFQWVWFQWKVVPPEPTCSCGSFELIKKRANMWWENGKRFREDSYCCGYYHQNVCHATVPVIPRPTGPGLQVPEVDSAMLDQLNPIKEYSTKANQLSTPGGIISEILRFAFPIAGIILFVMLVLAGLKMLTGATNSKSLDEGKQMITTAILGFIILFAAYWIAQLLEIIFGIKILGN